jgi:dTDP-4-dehydrorhamnose 3,5-epimerase
MFKKPFLIKNKRFIDKRGFFQEIYKKKDCKIPLFFTAIAYSKKNVIRGLHFQTTNKQTKVIHVVHGAILDVAVNLKKNSKNFGKVYMFKLNQGDTLVVPNSFAHGYECLSKTSTVLYHLDNYRNSKKENGISYNDKTLNIKWKTKKPIVSIRDKNSETFVNFKKNLKTL